MVARDKKERGRKRNGVSNPRKGAVFIGARPCVPCGTPYSIVNWRESSRKCKQEPERKHGPAKELKRSIAEATLCRSDEPPPLNRRIEFIKDTVKDTAVDN